MDEIADAHQYLRMKNVDLLSIESLVVRSGADAVNNDGKIDPEIETKKTPSARVPTIKTREVNEEAREAGADLILEGERFEPRRQTFLYVND